MAAPLVGIVMGSDSDWETMQHASERLREFDVAHESRVVSAHRTPDLLFRYAQEARERGLRCIIAGAGGAAHLPGMLAAKTTLPVLGVPVTVQAASGARFPALHRPDAGGCAGRHLRDRGGGRPQRGALRRGAPGGERPGVGQAPGGVPQPPRPSAC